MRSNVPECVFVPKELDNLLLPDHSMIDDKILASMFDDIHDDPVSCTKHKQYLFTTDISADSMTNSTVTCNNTDDDSVGNTSIAALDVYEVFNDNIQ